MPKKGTRRISKRFRQLPNTAQLDDGIRAHWDTRKTVTENYASLGLALSLNDIVKRKGFSQRVAQLDLQTRTLAAADTIGVEDDEIEAPYRHFVQGDDAADVRHGSVLDDIKNSRRRSSGQQQKAAETKEKRKRPQPEFLRRLLDKYGENYGRMTLDTLLNPKQFSASQLRSLVRKYAA